MFIARPEEEQRMLDATRASQEKRAENKKAREAKEATIKAGLAFQEKRKGESSKGGNSN